MPAVPSPTSNIVIKIFQIFKTILGPAWYVMFGYQYCYSLQASVSDCQDGEDEFYTKIADYLNYHPNSLLQSQESLEVGRYSLCQGRLLDSLSIERNDDLSSVWLLAGFFRAFVRPSVMFPGPGRHDGVISLLIGQ